MRGGYRVSWSTVDWVKAIQKVLAQPPWPGRPTPRDYAALTPLIWEHVNPYGRFDLDMNARLALL